MQNEGKEQSMGEKTVFVVRLTAIGDTLIAARSVLALIDAGFDPVFCTSRACSEVALCIPGLRYVVILEKDRTKQKVSGCPSVPCTAGRHDRRDSGVCDREKILGW